MALPLDIWADTRNTTEYRDNSKQLDEFWRHNFSSLAAELRTAFPSSAARMLPFLPPFPIVSRFAKDSARQYVKRPRRTFKALTKPQTERLETVLKELDYDRFLLETTQRLHVQHSQVIVALPGDDGVPRLRAFSPWECEISLRDPTQRLLHRAAETIKVRVPLGTKADGVAYFGTWVLSRDEAYEEGPKGKRSLFHADDPEDQSNPLGRLPVVGVRTVPATPGFWMPELPDDLLNVQIMVCLIVADILFTCHHQCHAQRYVAGDGAKQAAAEMTTGPDELWVFEGGEEGGLTLGVLENNPAVEKYLRAVETLLSLWAHLRYTSPQPLSGSTGITGDAKRAETEDQLEERERQEGLLQDMERRLIPLLVEVQRTQPLSDDLVAPSDVLTQYIYTQSRANALQEQQALQLSFAAGLDSAIEFIARTEGLSIEEAETRFEERAERWLAHLKKLKAAGAQSSDIPGLDKNASAMGES